MQKYLKVDLTWKGERRFVLRFNLVPDEVLYDSAVDSPDKIPSWWKDISLRMLKDFADRDHAIKDLTLISVNRSETLSLLDIKWVCAVGSVRCLMNSKWYIKYGTREPRASDYEPAARNFVFDTLQKMSAIRMARDQGLIDTETLT